MEPQVHHTQPLRRRRSRSRRTCTSSYIVRSGDMALPAFHSAGTSTKVRLWKCRAIRSKLRWPEVLTSSEEATTTG